MWSLHKRIFMARKSKYKDIVLDIVLNKESVSTNQVIKNIRKKTGKNVHWYLIDRILNELRNEGKIEKQVIKLGEHKIFMWKKK